MLAVAPSAEARRNVYIVGQANDAVAALDIGAAGALTPVAGSPFSSGGDEPVSVAIAPNGSHLYTPNVSSTPPHLAAYDVDGATGGLTLKPSAANVLGAIPLGNAITPDGRFQYVNERSSTDISAFAVAGNGTLTPVPGSPFPATDSTAIAVSADGRFVYLGNQDGTIAGFAIAANGALASLGTPTPSGGGDVFGLAVSPDGRFLYSANRTTDNVSGFAIATDGSLTPVPGSPFTAGDQPVSLAVDPASSHLFAANSGTVGSVSAYAIGADGSLVAAPGSPFATGNARNLALTPDGARLYVALFSTAGVAGYSVAADGGLSPLPGSPYMSAANSPDVQAITVTPNQGPTGAALTVDPAKAGKPTGLSAAAGSDPDGTVAAYAWDFGDGAGAETTAPATEHVYATQGAYTATVRLVDNEGCSDRVLYGGQNAYCNGSSAARASAPVDLLPTVKLKGGKTQELGKSVALKVKADEAVTATAKGTLIVKGGKSKLAAKTAKFKLKKRKVKVKPNKAKTLKLKLSPAAAAAAAEALSSGGTATAKVTLKAKDSAGGTAKASRKVRLKG